MKLLRVVLPLVALLFVTRCTLAADINALVDDLADEKKRAAAIAEIAKLGAAAEADLKKIEMTKKLEDRPLAIVRHLIGNILINSSPLKPIDAANLAPFGEDKDKKVEGDKSILIDPNPETRTKNKVIVLSGEFALEQGPLEYLVVSKGPNSKVHETVLAVDARPHDVCYALLACDYSAYTNEVGEEGFVQLPKESGVLMSVEFEWEAPNEKIGELPPEPKPGDSPAADPKPTDPKPDEKPNPNKHLVRVPIEFFAFNLQTEKTMKHVPFIFTGSKFEKDPQTGKMLFLADFDKSIAAVRLDPIAVLNSPLNTRSINPLHANGYAVNWHVIPKRHTKCKLVFEPYTGPELTETDFTDTGEHKGEGMKTEWAK